MAQVLSLLLLLLSAPNSLPGKESPHSARFPPGCEGIPLLGPEYISFAKN